MSDLKDKQPPAPLRDVFQQSLTDSGGNSPTAFIAILDELDRRMQGTSDLMSENNAVFQSLTDWYNDANTTLKELPTELGSSVSVGLRRVIPELTQQMEEKVTTGARNGAMASQDAIETLKGATERYEEKKRKLTTLAILGLPTAFAAAILIGFLFASFIIPALPTTWQWPCKIIGSDYRMANDRSSTTTFCVIQRD
ncbi:hypothetical protein [uncultured Aliiroseovarius sp.]|uniref:hypothetical protein n=1 Tax=uncultured Aliiroseovarius sp. TaxID=1658783 RepID=UPI00259193D9|nr:hypothetical protein [uncultured Aliiroseovarius sp.]